MTWYSATSKKLKLAPETFVENGTYSPETYGLDGFKSVTVNLPRIGGLEVHEKIIYSSTYSIVE